MPVVALDRQFVVWDEGDTSDPDLVLRFGLSDHALDWKKIADRRRVIILAEAGGGKTTEMREQTRLLKEVGQFAVYATVEDVGQDGLESALLDPGDTERFAAWKKSDGDGWFLIDSIDEAKLRNVRLEKALRRLAGGLVGFERRAHIILSGRVTDWEFRRDLQRVNEILPIPRDPTLPPPPSGQELLSGALRRELQTTSAVQSEKAVVVVMAALDVPRIRQFAAAKDAPQLDGFLTEIEKGNLWQFARRPLDLGWLVDYWRDHGRIGSLAEMIKNSLYHRAYETNAERKQNDSLDVETALRAAERVGAALVFGRRDTLSIPDSEIVLADEDPALDLVQILPDLSSDNRLRFLGRPIFDPATFGRARLHNDNQGVVRAYLTATWLCRLREQNLSQRDLRDLLFTTTYGIDVVKPSMQETAAWLALRNEDIAREIAQRDPSLALTAGDPGSLSTASRVSILTAIVERITKGEEVGLLDHDSVRRFSRADLAECIHQLWKQHQRHANVQEFLLRIIWLGEIKECSDLIETATLDGQSDLHWRLIVGKALMASGSEQIKQRYVVFVREQCATIPSEVVWDAIDELFPQMFSVQDFLSILSTMDAAEVDGINDLRWRSPRWIQRLTMQSDLERLLRGLLDRLGEFAGQIGHIPDSREEAYCAALTASACGLLEMCGVGEAPSDTIDAAIQVGIRNRYGHRTQNERTIISALSESSPRRQLTFWHASSHLCGHRFLRRQPIMNPTQLHAFGCCPNLTVDDIDWLLTDAVQRSARHERLLALNTSLSIWRDRGESSQTLLVRIEAVARQESELMNLYNGWLAPPPQSEDMLALEQQIEDGRREAEARRIESEKSWREFVGQLQRDPDQLRRVSPPKAGEIDGRLYHLWQLLQNTVDVTTRYAIGSVAPLVPMLGPDVTEAFQDGLIRYWRFWEPRLKSTRRKGERNQIRIVDCMGIVGVTLEANSRLRWGQSLSANEATIAAKYATLEINGFPPWLVELADTKPKEVREVLLNEVVAELNDPEPRTRYDTLEDISRCATPIKKVIVNALLRELDERPTIRSEALEPLLRIIATGIEAGNEHLATLVLSRFRAEEDLQKASLYLGAAIAVAPGVATGEFVERLASLQPYEQRTLAEYVLPLLFGTTFGTEGQPRPALDFESLERLVKIAFSSIRVTDDNERKDGEAFTPDFRDNAQHARGAAFNQLANTPGRPTFNALLSLADDPDCPVPRRKLLELAHMRAAQDSESAPWPPAELCAFEQHAQAAPTTSRDLQKLSLRRLEDIQHDLLHADFAQGAALKALPNEDAVQNWVADRLRLIQGRSYSVEREPQVVEKKEPDVRLRTKVADASVPIEIKVVESWSITELEQALTDQLCGRYLRARDGRHGILLLVHQHRRPVGWKHEPSSGESWTFDEVVIHLRDVAERISGESGDAPQPEISVLDVSSVKSASLKMPKTRVSKSS